MNEVVLIGGLINDGFDIPFVLKDGPYKGTKILARPALAEEVRVFLQTPGEWIDRVAKLLAGKIKGWNIGGPASDDPKKLIALPVTVESIKSLKYPVIDWMVDCVCGYAVRDEATDAKN